MKKKLTRREFVGSVSRTVAGAGVVAIAGKVVGAPVDRSRVVEVQAPGAVASGRKVDPVAVRKMVERGLGELAGTENPLRRWFAPSDRVGLKVNCLGRPRIYTHHELVRAFSDLLLDAGIPADRILVWDRFEKHMTDCGFKMNPEGPGVRVLATEPASGEGGLHDVRQGFSSEKDRAEARAEGNKVSQLSRIFTEQCDKVINLAVLKDHGLAGVTLCLKNIAFGLCTNNRRFHGPAEIGPFIADFCARPDVRKKFVLHVIDGLEGCYDQGPCPGSEDVLFTPNTLWFGADPVALDALGTRVIEAKRKEKGLRNLRQSGRHPDHIELAARLGLGTDDPARVDLKKIVLGRG